MFFSNPILSKIEDLLLEKAKEEVQRRIDAGNLDPQQMAIEVKDLFTGLWSEERAKAKMALKAYSSISKGKTEEAFIAALENAAPSWFSIERVDSIGTPMVLAVPWLVVQSRTTIGMTGLLKPRIEFQHMDPLSIRAFAEEAVGKFFRSTVNRLTKIKHDFKMNMPYAHKASIVKTIKKDWYYLGVDEAPSRIDMIILVDTGFRDDWNKKHRDIDFRPQERRFSRDSLSKWGLDAQFEKCLRKSY